jgi:hypothetical protein
MSTPSEPISHAPRINGATRASSLDDDDADIANLLQNLVPASFDEPYGTHSHESEDVNPSPQASPLVPRNQAQQAPQLAPWPVNTVPGNNAWAPNKNGCIFETDMYWRFCYDYLLIIYDMHLNGFGSGPQAPAPSNVQPNLWASPVSEDVNMNPPPNGYIVYPPTNYVNNLSYIRPPPNQNQMWVRQKVAVPPPQPYPNYGVSPQRR